MLPTQRQAITQMTPSSRDIVSAYFGLGENMYDDLESMGASQADVVLCLLRTHGDDTKKDIERLIGRPITYCPPDPSLDPKPHDKLPIGDTSPRVLFVAPNPRLPTTDAFQRYRLIRPGLSVEQLMRRGVTRRDIRELSNSSYVVFDHDA